MKKLTVCLSLLLLSGCATMEPNALRGAPHDHPTDLAPSPTIASHSCADSKAGKGNADQADTNISKNDGLMQEPSPAQKKQIHYRELYALNIADVLTGERCTLYAQLTIGQQGNLIVSGQNAMMLSVSQ